MALLPLAGHPTLAAKLPTSREQLKKEATHIVAGTVQAVSQSHESAGQYEVTRYTAELNVHAVEKGQGIVPGGVIKVRYWSKTWRGAGQPPPDDSGHRSRPNIGDAVRAYLVDRGYNGAGYTTDGGFDVYFNNGFEIIDPPR